MFAGGLLLPYSAHSRTPRDTPLVQHPPNELTLQPCCHQPNPCCRRSWSAGAALWSQAVNLWLGSQGAKRMCRYGEFHLCCFLQSKGLGVSEGVRRPLNAPKHRDRMEDSWATHGTLGTLTEQQPSSSTPSSPAAPCLGVWAPAHIALLPPLCATSAAFLCQEMLPEPWPSIRGMLHVHHSSSTPLTTICGFSTAPTLPAVLPWSWTWWLRAEPAQGGRTRAVSHRAPPCSIQHSRLLGGLSTPGEMGAGSHR